MVIAIDNLSIAVTLASRAYHHVVEMKKRACHSGSLGASCGDSSAQFAGNEDEAHYGDQ
jgi:hypothetical protein